MGDVQSKAHDIRDAIMDWLGFTHDAVNDTWKLKDGYTNFEKIVDALKFMSAWKLSSSLLKLLTGKGLFATLFGSKAGAGIVGGTTASKGLAASVFGTSSTLGITKLFDETGQVSGLAYHNGFWGKVASLSDTVGIWLMDKFPKLFGGLKGFEDIGNFSKVTAILTPILHTIDLVSNSEFFRRGLGAIFNISWQTISTVGGGVIDVIKGLSVSIDNVLSPLGLFSSDLGMVATGVGLLATGNPLGALVLGFEAVTLAVRGFGWLMSDAVDEVDLFHELSSQTKAKVEPFIDSVNELEASIQLIDYGNLVISDDIVTDIKGKVETISQTLINELDMDKNDALNKLNPIKNLYTEEEFAEVLTKVEGFYDDQKTKVTFGEDRINELVATARTQGRELQEHELAEINRITKDMLDTGIRHLSENETEALVIKERLKQNKERLTVEEAQNILKQSKELKEKSIQDAEDQYNGVLTAAVLLKEAGAINEEEYDAMVQNAEEAKNEQIEKATETYEQIKEETRIGMGNLANTIDFESGAIKTKWDMFMSGLYEITAGWGASITSWLDGIRASFGLVKVDAEAMANRQNQWYKPQPYNTNQTRYGGPRGYANGGFVSSGEIFMANENGKAEMIGRFGRTTAVANNEQIVAGISQGVYNAVVQANKGGNQPINITLPVNVGGTRVGTELIRYLRNTQEETGEYILAFD